MSAWGGHTVIYVGGKRGTCGAGNIQHVGAGTNMQGNTPCGIREGQGKLSSLDVGAGTEKES